MTLEKAINKLIASQNFNACISRSNSYYSIWLYYAHSHATDNQTKDIYRLCACIRNENLANQIRKPIEFAFNTQHMFSNDWEIVGGNDSIINEYSIDELKPVVFAHWSKNMSGGYTLKINDALMGSVGIDKTQSPYKYLSEPDVPRRAHKQFDTFQDAVNNTKARIEEFLMCVSEDISIRWPEDPEEPVIE